MRRLLVLTALALAACPAPKPAPPSLSGDGWKVTLEGTTFTFARGDEALVSLPFDAFRVGTVNALDPLLSYDPYWLVLEDPVFPQVTPPGFSWRTPTEAAAVVDGDALVLNLTYNRILSAQVRATKSAEGHLVFTFVPSGDATPAFLRVRLGVDSQEGFYGLGEWFDGINHRGKLRALQLEPDLSTESAASENHVSIPFFTSSRAWGAFFESRRHGVLDLGKSDASVVEVTFGTAEVSSAGLTFHLFAASHPLDVLPQYYAHTGAPRLPAEWATGPWIWRNENRDQAEVEDDVRQIRALKLPTSGLWIDRPYATEVNTFDFKPDQFPDAGAMVQTIHAAGLELALWHTPYLAMGAEPFLTEATTNDYFPVEKGANLNRWSPPLDVTKPEAVAFWKRNLTAYTGLGVKGFKLDFAEDVAGGVSGRRSGWTFHDGQTDRTMTDGYSRGYHAMYRGALGSEDGFLLVRHAVWGEQTSGLIVWPGDIDATLTRFGESFVDRGGMTRAGVGGLPSAVRAGIGLSMSGFLFASDTGGYRHSPPDKETFLRWVEHSALMPVMQVGDSSSQPPWVFNAENGRDQETLDTYRAYASLHLRLFPFFWTELRRADQRAVVRPFGLQWPELGQHPEDQYSLGDALLVAPVETKGATSRALVKPPGRWFSFDDGAELSGAAGDLVIVPAPLTKGPLFLREGALVPMLEPAMQTLSAALDPTVRSFANNAGALWVRVQPASTPSEYTVFDGAKLTQAGQTVTASAGTRFTTAVVWELRGVSVGSVTHGGAAVSPVADENALEAAASGVLISAGRVLIKTPLDGAPTSW